MSLLTDGPFSPDIEKVRAGIRGMHKAWFDLADRLNRLGQRIATTPQEFQTQEGLADSRTIALLLFFRALSNFQGSVLMAERGMVVEARTLARSCLESAICIAGCQKNPNQSQLLLRDDLQSRRMKIKFILRNPALLTAEARAELERLLTLIEARDNVATLNFRDIANEAGIEGIYLFHRLLSGDAAHPSASSLNRYVVEKEESETVVTWLPSIENNEIPDTLNFACNFLILACTGLKGILVDPSTDRELSEAYAEFERLAALPLPKGKDYGSLADSLERG
jgi:hypothetical protein